MKERLEKKLTGSLSPIYIAISDDSAAHAGHAGARAGGETHFTVTIVADAFSGKNRVARHRMVYGSINEEFEGRLHALVINTFTPEEYDLA